MHTDTQTPFILWFYSYMKRRKEKKHSYKNHILNKKINTDKGGGEHWVNQGTRHILKGKRKKQENNVKENYH